MPTYTRGDATITYDERGDGFPLLALAPGGMRSTIDFWQHAALNPWASYTDDFRVIVMDQRNSGSSTGPVDTADPWGMYADDQLGLLDHLGVDKFAVLGCCIGGSFILKLVEKASDRIVAAVLEQPIGVQDSNRELFAGLQSSWADELSTTRTDLDGDEVKRFLAAMWSRDFVVSVEPEVIENCSVPLLVLPGIDDFHPGETGRQIAAMAPKAETIEPWKDTPENIATATDRVRTWLQSATKG